MQRPARRKANLTDQGFGLAGRPAGVLTDVAPVNQRQNQEKPDGTAQKGDLHGVNLAVQRLDACRHNRRNGAGQQNPKGPAVVVSQHVSVRCKGFER